MTEKSKNNEKGDDHEYDYLRDGPARYLGYANEFGEAFRKIMSAAVVSSCPVRFRNKILSRFNVCWWLFVSMGQLTNVPS